MTDLEQIRTLAHDIRKERDEAVMKTGIAGAGPAAIRATVAEELIALLDSLPPPTSPDRIPPAIRASLDRYASIGVRTGGTLQAILSNDLQGAFARADPETRDAMPAIVAYIANQLPAGCHGSEEIVERWIARPRS